ncbi:hypothetical protein [Streptomyces sp. MBT65]|uniref:hypothetical protein n=1 Tax=Streptomyces sp. MBT65 TaxID=1488395 RepID=UPI001F19A206|nr:hypothetical protein [Streptomyces sp. MBT65]
MSARRHPRGRISLSRADRTARLGRLLAALPQPTAGEWWPGLEPWLGEETDEAALHAVGDLGITGPVDLTLRTHGGPNAQPALVVGCDGKNLWITGPGGARLGETILTEPASTLRILTVGEYVEVYADGTFALTTLCYTGSPAPWTAVTDGHTRTIPTRPIRLPDPRRDDASAVWPGPYSG